MKISVLAAAAALTALLLAGCGGDNSTVATATTSAGGSTATTNSASSATTSDSASSGTTAEPAADTTTPSFSGDSNNEFCQAARELEASDIASTLSGSGADVKAGFEKAQAAIDDLKDKAPSEIKDDVNTLAAGIQKIRDFYAKYDYDQAKIQAAATKDPTVIQDALSGFNNADFEAASARVTAYGAQVCGISDTTETT
jgi:hypothetical protein